MPRRLVLTALIAALASCGRGAIAPADTASGTRSRPRPPADIETARLLASGETLVAVARGSDLGVHAAPGTERAYMHLDAANPWGQRLRLLVIRGTTDDDGDIWLRIQLPIWPNGQAGWVAASDVRVAPTRERLVVDLSERELIRLNEGRAVAKVPVAIGSAGTPTPPGRYFVWAKVTPTVLQAPTASSSSVCRDSPIRSSRGRSGPGSPGSRSTGPTIPAKPVMP
jgi:hypothetical protein